MSEDVTDKPLPPAPEMELATTAHFMHLAEDSFQPMESSDSFLLRTTDIEKLSGGAVGARVYRAVPDGKKHTTPWHWHEWGYQVGYITRGWAIYEFEGVGEVRVEAGSFLFQPPNNRHRELDSSDDFEGVEITFPGKVKTIGIVPDDAEPNGWKRFEVEPEG